MKNYVVYCHTLKNDGRKYIGITAQKYVKEKGHQQIIINGGTKNEIIR